MHRLRKAACHKGVTLMPVCALVVGCAGCPRGAASESTQPSRVAELDEALSPAHTVAAFRSLGGAHFHGTARWSVAAQTQGQGAQAPAPLSITTTTDVWIDRSSRYHLLESNDNDNGRDVTVVGRELAVALRYGKLGRRPAREPEPTQLLTEALGAAGAAWRLVRAQTSVSETASGGTWEKWLGSKRRVFKLTAREGGGGGAGGNEGPLSQWRASLVVERITGELVLLCRPGNPAPISVVVAAHLEGSYHAQRDGKPISGTFEVSGGLDEIGKTADIALPPQAESARVRQRTVLEERALLGQGDAMHGSLP